MGSFVPAQACPALPVREARVPAWARSGEGTATSACAISPRCTTADLESLVEGTRRADATVHLAFNHNFSRFAENSESDRQAIATLGAALADTGKPLVVTSGVLMCRPEPGTTATEDSPTRTSAEVPRAASGCNLSIVRHPQVHDPRRRGLITYAIAIAREKGVSA
jgi:hypothetical protein